MSIIEEGRKLYESGQIEEIKKEAMNLLEDFIGALSGNKLSIGKAIGTFVKFPYLVREHMLWANMELFIQGVYIEDEDVDKLRAKLSEHYSKDDNYRRLLMCIDRAETRSKIDYLINATRNLMDDKINREEYFRISQAIVETLPEDLEFLKDNFSDEEIFYNINVQGLVKSGLMIQTTYNANGEQGFLFTEAAELVVMFGLKSWKENEKVKKDDENFEK